MSIQPVPELKFFGPTAIIFGLISVVFYILIIRPLLPNTVTEGGANNNNNARRGGVVTGQNNNGTAAATQQQAAVDKQPQIPCTRTPPHLNQNVTAINNGSNVLLDGMVAFKHTQAATAPAQDGDRKARARLFSNLVAAAEAPPAKGSNVAVALPLSSVQCPQQRQVLVLLATYYNLMVLVAVPPTTTRTNFDKKDALTRLRGSSSLLTESILPTHRIVFCSTVTGRVAFVRQLQRIELVLDFDPEVKDLLGRFGHRVIVYGQENSNAGSENDGISKLGRALL